MGRRLDVGNLPFITSEAALHKLFGRAGTVESVNVVRDLATGRARRFAIVEMATDQEARKAIAALDQHDVGGRRLTVSEARPTRVGRASISTRSPRLLANSPRRSTCGSRARAAVATRTGVRHFPVHQ